MVVRTESERKITEDVPQVKSYFFVKEFGPK